MASAERIKTSQVFQDKDDMEGRMNREQQKEKIRRQRKQRIQELMGLGCCQAVISRIMNLSKTAIKNLQREMGLPPRLPVIKHSPRPYRKHSLAEKRVDEVVQRFFGGQLPQDTDQLAKVMTNFPESVPDKLKAKMNQAEWEQYRAHITTNIQAEIHARENRSYVN
jgi:hypothetical protein